MLKTAAILIGGRARRLGGVDKSRITIAGRTIFERQVDVLRGLVDHIVIVGGDDHPGRPDGIEAVADRWPGGGSLGGIATALSVAQGPVLVLACDMPFVTGAFLSRVREALTPDVDAAIPKTADGWHPLCAAYARACLEPMRRRVEEGRLKVVDALDGLRVREIGVAEVAAFDPDGRLLTNVNTPDDLARAAATGA